MRNIAAATAATTIARDTSEALAKDRRARASKPPLEALAAPSQPVVAERVSELERCCRERGGCGSVTRRQATLKPMRVVSDSRRPHSRPDERRGAARRPVEHSLPRLRARACACMCTYGCVRACMCTYACKHGVERSLSRLQRLAMPTRTLRGGARVAAALPVAQKLLDVGARLVGEGAWGVPDLRAGCDYREPAARGVASLGGGKTRWPRRPAIGLVEGGVIARTGGADESAAAVDGRVGARWLARCATGAAMAQVRLEVLAVDLPRRVSDCCRREVLICEYLRRVALALPTLAIEAAEELRGVAIRSRRRRRL